MCKTGGVAVDRVLARIQELGAQNWHLQNLRVSYLRETSISTINMYLLIEVRHDILIQCHVINIRVKRNQLCLKIY